MQTTISNPITNLKNNKGMPELQLKQLQYESDTWKRSLAFMIDENIYLKNRITEILRNGFEKNQLEGLEDFQNRFIKEDELISLLRNEVAELDKLLLREIFEDGKIINTVNQKLTRLRANISTAEKKLGDLKMAFNNYILGTT